MDIKLEMKKNQRKSYRHYNAKVLLKVLILTLIFSTSCSRPSSANKDIPAAQSGSGSSLSSDSEEYFTAAAIKEGDLIHRRINGKSYRKNDNIALEDLRYLKLLHYNFQHEIQAGEMIVHKEIADEILDIFKELYAVGYEIESMYLVDRYWPEKKIDSENYDEGVEADAESMRQNNTSCFNYRVVPDSAKLSKHALGYAIDINPLPNPYVVYDRNGNPVVQGGGDASYIDRRNKREHMIDYEDPAYRIFTAHGFKWGGDWNSSKDYQHFFYSGVK